MCKIEFDDQIDLELAVNGKNLMCIIWELDQWLRGKQKYHDIDKISIDDIRNELRVIMDENGLSFNHKIFT